MLHFYFPPGFPSQGAVEVCTFKHAGHQQPLLEQLFMTKRVSNKHEMCLVRARTQHYIPNCFFNYIDSYFILPPSLLSTLFAVLLSSTSLTPLFILSHFVMEDYLAMELLLNMDNWMNCLQKTHFRLLLHVHEASKASDWKHTFFLSPSLRRAWVGEKKVGEGLVYLFIDTGAELKAWSLITVVPESKCGSDPGYRSGLKYLQCVSFSETFHHYIIPHHVFQGHRKKDKLHSTSVKAFF